jgi:hypothetical protein
MRTALALTALLAMAARPGAADEIDPGEAYGQLVLQVQADSTGELGVPFTGPVRLGRDWSVFTDGTVALVFSLNERIRHAPTAANAEIKTASPFSLEVLFGALVAGQAGRARGNCDLYEPQESSYRVVVTWFGPKGRVNRFQVGNEFEVTCPPRLVELLNQIFYFEKLEIIPSLPIGPD